MGDSFSFSLSQTSLLRQPIEPDEGNEACKIVELRNVCVLATFTTRKMLRCVVINMRKFSNILTHSARKTFKPAKFG